MQAKVSSYITVCVKGTLHQNQVSPALCIFFNIYLSFSGQILSEDAEDAIMKLHWYITEIKMKAKFEDECGPSEGGQN